MALVRHKAFSSHGGSVVGHIVFDDVTGAVVDIVCSTGERYRGNMRSSGRVVDVPESRVDESLGIDGLGLFMVVRERGGPWEPDFNYSFGSAPAQEKADGQT